jgi:sensor domain CHASE-containing protein
METLIIEVFVQKQIAHEIKINGAFLGLEKLISKIQTHPQIHLGRNTPNAMNYIKTLGDTAAHDRTYITQPQDVDEHKLEIRRVMQDLLNQANIYPKS